MEPLNATAIERDKRQPKAQQMLGLADDEYLNLPDLPEPAQQSKGGTFSAHSYRRRGPTTRMWACVALSLWVVTMTLQAQSASGQDGMGELGFKPGSAVHDRHFDLGFKPGSAVHDRKFDPTPTHCLS